MRNLNRLVLVLALLASASPASAAGRTRAPEQHGDFVIAGGGAAGAVLAVRLAEKLHKSGKPGRIVIIEAGGNQPNRLLAAHAHSADPDSPLSHNLNLDYPVQYLPDARASQGRYNFRADKGGDLHTRGKGRGGSSNHHAGFNLFPPKSDWREIAALTGDASWSPEAMAEHEDVVRGMIPIKTTGLKSTRALGDRHPQTAVDPNDDAVREQLPENLLSVPVNVSGELRYGPRELLNDAMKKYPGRIVTLENTIVDRAVVDATGRVSSVRVLRGGRLGADHDPRGHETAETIHVDKAFVDSTGAFETPGTMWRSGLGPTAKLKGLGIETVVDLPGAGQGLGSRIEVPLIHKQGLFALGKLLLKARSRNGAAFLQGRKSDPSLPEADGVQIGLTGKFNGYNWGYSDDIVGGAFTQLDLQARTHSSGTVEPQSSDPRVRPEIHFNMFDPTTDPQGKDLKAAVKGFRQMLARSRKMGGKQVWDQETNAWAPIEQFERMSDAQIGARMKKIAWDHHPSGTARIGKDGDPETVVRSDFRVRGTDNYFAVSLALFKKPLGVFPVLGLYTVAVKAADGLYDRFYPSRQVSANTR